MTFKLPKELNKLANDIEFAEAIGIGLAELQRRGLVNETYHGFCDRIASNSLHNARFKTAGIEHKGLVREVQP